MKKKFVIIIICVIVAILGLSLFIGLKSRRTTEKIAKDNDDKNNNAISQDSDNMNNITSNILGSEQSQVAVSTSMLQTEIETYNFDIENALGDSVGGSKVKAMIDDIISMNYSNIGQKGKFVSIEAINITSYDKSESLINSCQLASNNNNSENVENAVSEMELLRTRINSSKNYKLTATYENKIIVKVEINHL